MEEGNLSLKQYEESDVPYRLPDNMDIFTWSVPFLVEKVIGMIYQIVQKTGIDDEDEPLKDEAIHLIQDQAFEQSKQQHKSTFKAKLASFTKMQ